MFCDLICDSETAVSYSSLYCSRSSCLSVPAILTSPSLSHVCLSVRLCDGSRQVIAGTQPAVPPARRIRGGAEATAGDGGEATGAAAARARGYQQERVRSAAQAGGHSWLTPPVNVKYRE